MLNIEALLAPISPDRPAGDDLAFSPEIDEIARARLADDPSLEQGAWVTALKEADWKFVGKRCAHLLETRSKDLQLAVWLAEASAKTGGMRGLADAVQVVGTLCERYWIALHPQADEDGCERRIGNLAWIASRLAPLVAEAMPAQLDDCVACLSALEALEQAVDARLGADGPSFRLGRSALVDAIDLLQPAVVAGKTGERAAGLPVAQSVLALPSRIDGPVLQREQALAQLRQVAEFFRRTEPHSPVAYLAEKAARWGEQPLHAWLRSVMKDDASLARLEDLLGIEPPPT